MQKAAQFVQDRSNLCPLAAVAVVYGRFSCVLCGEMHQESNINLSRTKLIVEQNKSDQLVVPTVIIRFELPVFLAIVGKTGIGSFTSR
jgi:hypothetical protein